MSQTLFHVISAARQACGLTRKLSVLRWISVAMSASRFHDKEICNCCPPRLWLTLNSAMTKRRHLGIFLKMPDCWLNVLADSVIVLNQEWLRPPTLQAMTRCSQVWCKSRYAEKIFQERGYDTRYIGFSSVDRFLPEVAKSFDRFIHVAGRSTLKGTQVLLDVWRRHPEWPPLVVVTRDRQWVKYQGLNIRVMRHFVPEADLAILMNSAECICARQRLGRFWALHQ
ncbi:MAG: hypothetical protein IPN53_14730 [Comamonadaceae bacterium]|nr:hypothetical protein [Comamonadaceae bacterium]